MCQVIRKQVQRVGGSPLVLERAEEQVVVPMESAEEEEEEEQAVVTGQGFEEGLGWAQEAFVGYLR
jgi:hypothetical protein